MSSSPPEATVSLSSGCHDKIPQTVWLKPQKLIFSSFGAWEDQDQGPAGSELWGGLSSWFSDSCLRGCLSKHSHAGGFGLQYMNLGGCDSVHSSHLPEGRSRKVPLFGEYNCSPVLVRVRRCESRNEKHLRGRQCGSAAGTKPLITCVPVDRMMITAEREAQS